MNDQIQGQLSNLLSRLEPLMGAWARGAAVSFQNLKQRWRDNATKLNETLRGIGGASTDCRHRVYRCRLSRTDRQVQIRVRPGGGR
ncbi:MAG: WXG100 family type VII secretion target [Pseudonocardiaceae bacterium]